MNKWMLDVGVRQTNCDHGLDAACLSLYTYINVSFFPHHFLHNLVLPVLSCYRTLSSCNSYQAEKGGANVFPLRHMKRFLKRCRKVLSALFRMHELGDVRDWLVSLWSKAFVSIVTRSINGLKFRKEKNKGCLWVVWVFIAAKIYTGTGTKLLYRRSTTLDVTLNRTKSNPIDIEWVLKYAVGFLLMRGLHDRTVFAWMNPCKHWL